MSAVLPQPSSPAIIKGLFWTCI